MSGFHWVPIAVALVLVAVTACGSEPSAAEVNAARVEADSIIESYRDVFVEKGRCPLDVDDTRRDAVSIEALGHEVEDDMLATTGANLHLFVDAYEAGDFDELTRLADVLLAAADEL